MRLPLRQHARRRGLSLLEVLVAMAIFMLSIVVISQMVSTAANRGIRAQRSAKAALLAESRMAEFSSGILPLSMEAGETEVPFDEADEPDPNWRCLVKVEVPPYGFAATVPISADEEAAGLMQVTVRVGFFGSGGSTPDVEFVLTRLILNPVLRIPLPDPAPPASSTTPTMP